MTATPIPWDVDRADWLAGADWLSAPAFPWSDIELVVVHWPGGNGVPVSGDPAAVLRFVHNQHAYSVGSRGYNLGYSSSVDWLGRLIEIRGTRNRNAANAPAALNARSVSIQILTNLDGATTAAQDAGIRRLVGHFLRIAPNAAVIPHRDGPLYQAGATATACCGDRLSARVRAGEFLPDTVPEPEPPPIPPTPPAGAPVGLIIEETDMIFLARENEPDGALRAFWQGVPGVGRRRLTRPQVEIFLGTDQCFDCGTGRSLAGARSGDSITAVTAATMDAIIGPAIP